MKFIVLFCIAVALVAAAEARQVRYGAKSAAVESNLKMATFDPNEYSIVNDNGDSCVCISVPPPPPPPTSVQSVNSGYDGCVSIKARPASPVIDSDEPATGRKYYGGYGGYGGYGFYG